MIQTKIDFSPKEIPFCEREILRYAGVKKADESLLSLMRECIEEFREILDFRVCYEILPLTVEDGICELGHLRFSSHDLAKTLEESHSALIFAATLGVEPDRMIAKYGRLSPAKALMMQGIGTERIEAFCDAFCERIQTEQSSFLTPRFSPGYGDLSLHAQKDIFSLLDCPGKIGLTLSDSLLMSPSKSVSAIAGITSTKKSIRTNKCKNCKNTNCAFRGNT